MKKLPYRGLFLIILILILILVSLIVVKNSYKEYVIKGQCNKFDYDYEITLKYKNGYENLNHDNEYVLGNNMASIDFYFETNTQRKEDYDGIKNSFINDENLVFFKEFTLNNGMTGYAYSYYGSLKVVLNCINANETDDESFINYIVLNTIIKGKNGFDISDYETTFGIYQDLLNTIDYKVTESYSWFQKKKLST